MKNTQSALGEIDVSKATGPFLGPENLDFEFLGYFEEWHDMEFNKHLGTRRVPCATQLLGAYGAKLITLTENIQLDKGHKTTVVKASKKKPMQVRVTLNLLCGGSKNLRTKNL